MAESFTLSLSSYNQSVINHHSVQSTSTTFLCYFLSVNVLHRQDKRPNLAQEKVCMTEVKNQVA